MLVTGEPGIGKTGLARALTATAAAMGIRTGWGRCEEAAGAPALWPWSQAWAAGDAAGTATRVPAWPPAAPEARPRRRRRTSTRRPSGWPRHGRVAADAGPVLLVLDDLHRADGDTLHLVRRLGAMLAGLPVVLVLTSRDAEADITPELAEVLAELARAELVRVGLRGLDEAGVRDLRRGSTTTSRSPTRSRRRCGNGRTATRSSSAS